MDFYSMPSERLRQSQYGFKKGWSAIGKIVFMIMLAELARKVADESLMLLFLDLEKRLIEQPQRRWEKL